MAVRLVSVWSGSFIRALSSPKQCKFCRTTAKMAAQPSTKALGSSKIIDSHLHIWASPEEAADRYPYSPGYEPTLPGNVDFLLQCMEESGVDGALIVQPINHMFDHSLVTSALKKYPSKFTGCCLANPAEDGTGINQLESLILMEGYCAVRFNPYLWPLGQRMTNKIGKALFSKAGELGVPVGIMCMKGLNLHLSEIEELCSDFPSTTVLLDHLGFCKPATNDAEREAFSALLKLSRFPQEDQGLSLRQPALSLCELRFSLHRSSDRSHEVYVKFSALFRLSRESFPYVDTHHLLEQVVSSYGANRIMWGSDFPFVVPECGYKEAKEAAYHIATLIPLSSTDLEWIMGKTATNLFKNSWNTS